MSTPDLSAILSALTPAQQDAIRALIAQEAAKNAPPPPRELTPAERAELLLSQARSLFSGENTGFSAVAVVFYHRILELLENLTAAVYPAVTEVPAEPAVVPVVSVVTEPITTDGGAV